MLTKVTIRLYPNLSSKGKASIQFPLNLRSTFLSLILCEPCSRHRRERALGHSIASFLVSRIVGLESYSNVVSSYHPGCLIRRSCSHNPQEDQEAWILSVRAGGSHSLFIPTIRTEAHGYTWVPNSFSSIRCVRVFVQSLQGI